MFNDLSLSYLIVVIATMVFSIAIHEMMHSFAARALGDDTAQEAGRLTLNPLKHIDVMLTVVLPIVLILLRLPPIFIAKPVPFDPRNLRYGDFGMALVGLAGPFTNLVLATIAALIVRIAGIGAMTFVGQSAALFVEINLLLFVFNMLPLPPLDGSRLFYALAPEPLQRLMYQLETAGFGVTIVLLLVLSPFISPLVTDLVSTLYRFLLP